MKLGRTFLKLAVVALGIFCAFLISACVRSNGGITDAVGTAQASCSGCGKGTEYTLNDDEESYSLTAVGKNETRVDVPSKYKGKPVTGIASGAFIYSYGGGCSYVRYEGVKLKSLILPDTITEIESGAFSYSYENPSDSGVARATVDKFYYKGTIEQWCKVKIGETPVSSSTKFYINNKLISGELTIPESVTEIGGRAFGNCSAITKVNFHDKLTTIGAYAFGDCDGLTALDIPDSVTTIGGSAFYSCDGLTSVDIPDSVTYLGGAFGSCSNLEEVNLGEGVTYLSGGLFSYCTKLSKVNVKGILTGIGERAFLNCTSITELDLSNSEVTKIGYDAFQNCYNLTSFVIPAGVTEIGKFAFSGCVKLLEIYNLSALEITCGSEANGGVAYYALIVHSSLDEPSAIITVGDYIFFKGEENALLRYTGAGGAITLPENLDGENYGINASAFMGNTAITAVTVPNTVTKIGFKAFSGCSELEEITLSSLITEIADRTFYKCSALKSVELPAKIKSIGESAFADCEKLESVSCGTEIQTIADSAFENSAIISIALPETLESIGVKAFGNTDLKSIELPSKITSIRESTFEYCFRLVSVSLPDGLETIGGRAFRYCKSLKNIVLPASVKNLGREVFENCAALESADIGGVTELSYGTFDGCSSLSSVTFSCNLKKICQYAFRGCYGLESITLPEGLEVIDRMSFTQSGLKSVLIPSTVVYIYFDSFGSLLENITISAENTVYSGAGNCIIDIEKKTVIKGSKNSVIPADGSVTAIGNYAFYGIGITSFVVPEGVTSIGDFAFSRCLELTQISLPRSLKIIDFYAFYGCGNFENDIIITYAGTRAEWEQINLSMPWEHSTVWVQASDERFEG